MQADKLSMWNSAQATVSALGLQPGNTALLAMPLRYIAGQMMVVRSLAAQLQLWPVVPSLHPYAGLHEAPDFAALTPMQVYESLRVPHERSLLRRTLCLIIGGGPIPAGLEKALRTFPHAVWSTYGMTETLSHIALRRVSGDEATDFYTPLPGVTVGRAENGCLTIEAPALCDAKLFTKDLVDLQPDGRFRILGRADNTIISGGVKVQAEELERMLRPFFTKPFMITWIKDERLGQAVVLLSEDESPESLCRAAFLPPYWKPRHWVHVEQIPLTETGKPARAAAHELAERLL